MQLEIKLAGAESKVFLAGLRDQIDELLKKTTAPKSEPVETETEEEDDFAPPAKKTTVKKAAAAFEEEDEEPAPAKKAGKRASFDEEEEEEAPAPAKKAAKVTLDDVNDACREKAKSIGGKDGRDAVKKLLMKKWKTESVSELNPKDYAAVIEAMEV